MLNKPLLPVTCQAMPVRQHGVVLLVALIMLIAMTLAGLALVRSVDTGNVIAGNLAFQQSTANAGDSGIEDAVKWLENKNVDTTNPLFVTVQGDGSLGYIANSLLNPAAGQSWDAFWTATLVPSGRVKTMTIANGNTVAYIIQRMCDAEGDPAARKCSQPPGSSSGSSKGAGVVALKLSTQIYYRITSRITGPRNTVSYVQAFVAI